MEVAQIDQLAKALVAAQGKMTNPMKSLRADAGKRGTYHYADLADVCDIVRSVFSQHGLALVHLKQYRDGVAWMVAMLVHESGQTLSSEYQCPKFDGPQDEGSWWTYMRRYSTCSIAFVAGEADEDAQKAEAAIAVRAEIEAEDKRNEAQERLDRLAKRGTKMTSAYTGQEVKPGDKLEPEPAPKPETTAEDTSLLNKNLAKWLESNKISVAEFMLWVRGANPKKKKYFPDDVKAVDLPDDFIETILGAQDRVLAAITENRKGT